MWYVRVRLLITIFYWLCLIFKLCWICRMLVQTRPSFLCYLITTAISLAEAQRDIPNFNFGNTNNNNLGTSRDTSFNGFNTLGSPRETNPFTVSPRDQNVFGSFGPPRGFGNQQNPRQGLDFGDTSQSQYPFSTFEEKECPSGWDTFRQACYRFVRSPLHTRDDARRNCQVYCWRRLYQ